MPNRHRVKLSKKEIKEKYPVKVTVGEEVVQFTGKLFFVFLVFVSVALAVDIIHFSH